MREGIPWAFSMASGLLLAGCGGADERQTVKEPIGSEWQLVERDYPFVGEGGELVCAEYRRREASGLFAVEREFYLVDRMNDKLAARGEMQAGLREKMLAEGLNGVETCDEARKFVRIKNDFPEAEPTPVVAPENVPEEPGARTDKVRESSVYDHFPTVQLKIWQSSTTFMRCSGALIGPYTVLTAAHCFPWPGGTLKVSVDYGALFPDPTQCIKGHPSGCNISPATGNMVVWVHHDFSGSLDKSDDVAVGNVSGWDVIGTDSNFFIRLTETIAPNSTSFAVHGYGANNHSGSGQGWGRRSLGVEGISGGSLNGMYWTAHATSGFGHPCKGDSGGPAVNFTKIPWDMSIGIFSTFEQVGNNACPQIGDEFNYTRVSRKVGWIDQLADGPPCTRFSSDGWLYRRCW